MDHQLSFHVQVAHRSEQKKGCIMLICLIVLEILILFSDNGERIYASLLLVRALDVLIRVGSAMYALCLTLGYIVLWARYVALVGWIGGLLYSFFFSTLVRLSQNPPWLDLTIGACLLIFLHIFITTPPLWKWNQIQKEAA